MVSEKAAEILKSLDAQVGEAWCRHQRVANACDDLLHCIIANGVFTTKIDGFIHAVNMTTPFLLRHIAEMDVAGRDELDLKCVTSWGATDSATRYAQWQVDFHWKIDTRPWQYLLLAKFMRRAYDEVIRSATGFADPDRQALLDGNLRFWDAVEISYGYRSEIIERSRQYTPHPDRTAGASERGYVYRQLIPEPSYEFRKLKFELIGPELGAGIADEVQIPTGFPRIPEVVHGTTTEAARTWIGTANEAGVCDDYLRMRLGDRFVPTRLNGWEAALLDLRRCVDPSPEDPLVIALAGTGEDLREAVVEFFVLAQSEFGRRLGGLDRTEISTLIETARPAVEQIMAADPEAKSKCEDFVSRVQRIYAVGGGRKRWQEDEQLMDLVRPVHPRYAAVDPLEPLPWHTRNPDRYRQRMSRLGYEL